MIQPKPFLHKLRLKQENKGNEQRIFSTLKILENGTPLPLPVEYKDIDATMLEWVENELKISFEGEKLPTFKLFANQRINEYSQTWSHLDDKGNVLMNFKTITRDNNPQKGNNQGNYFNIPGNRNYPMFIVPVLQNNQLIAYDMYSMKQPFCVNIEYTINIVTNKYELINEMNLLVNDKFKSINTYIFPNNHPMPLSLESVSDESEYSLDDRKYYSQTYKIILKAYIIKEEDFTITHLPSRIIVKTLGEKIKTKEKNKDIITVEENDYFNDDCGLRDEGEPLYYRLVTININIDLCHKETVFTMDGNVVIKKIETDNIYDFELYLNNEKQNLENDIQIYHEDEVKIIIEKKKMYEDSKLIITGFDPNIILNDPESALDEIDKEKKLNY
jgi:hypothetical protein